MLVIFVPALVFAAGRWGIAGAAWTWVGRIAIDQVLMFAIARAALGERVGIAAFARMAALSVSGAATVAIAGFAPMQMKVGVVAIAMAWCAGVAMDVLKNRWRTVPAA
jgi:hypothetical protein